MTEPPTGAPNAPEGETSAPRPAYFGIGCLTAIAGFWGGGMIAVLIAKLVGALTKCAAEPETGAPCNWFTYAVFGAITGLIVLPSIAIWLLRRGRARARNIERG